MTAAVGLTTLAAQAQLTSEWEGNAFLRYTTRYVFRGDQKAGQSMQANIQFQPTAGKNGFYVGGWANQPFASERRFEFDLYGGYDYNWQGFDLSAGVIGYFYPTSTKLSPNLPNRVDGTTSYSYELNISASREILKNWGATATLYYDIRLQALTPELSTGYRVPYTIGKYPASLDFSAFIGNSTVKNFFPDAKSDLGYKWKDSWVYYGGTISTTVYFTKNLSVAIGIQYGDTIGKAYMPVSLRGTGNRNIIVGGYGKDTSDNLYGYLSVGLRW